MDLVNGCDCKVVEAHPDVCQHCGFYGFAADERCSGCGIQTHRQCLAMDGMCDICRHGIHDMRCQLCHCEDVPCMGSRGETDRLTKVVVYHGRWWKRADAFVQDYHHVVVGLCKDVSGTFRPDELPDEGSRPMAVCITDQWYVSIPLVVHTWCGQCLFQVSPTQHDEWKRVIVERMEVPIRIEHGCLAVTNQERSSFETHECAFCGHLCGWTTFCIYQQTKKAGCVRCGERDDQTMCNTFFHPSCAVWAGMQRIVRLKEGSGMVCYHNKNFCRQHFDRSQHLYTVHLSGIHEMLGDVKACSIDTVPVDALQKGRRYYGKSGRKRGHD